MPIVAFSQVGIFISIWLRSSIVGDEKNTFPLVEHSENSPRVSSEQREKRWDSRQYRPVGSFTIHLEGLYLFKIPLQAECQPSKNTKVSFKILS